MGGGKNMEKECRHQMYCTLMEVPGRWIQDIGIFLTSLSSYSDILY